MPGKNDPGMSDEAVRKKTGKDWKQWFAILDRWGGRKHSHREMAAYLHEKQGVPGWWAQMVTVGYERARGMREKHQTAEGFSASRSKTFETPLAAVYRAWKDEAARREWLIGGTLAVSTANANKAIRGAWDGGKSRVAIGFYAKGAGKSQVAIDHQRLKTRADVARMKAFWGRQLERLAVFLQG